MPSVIEWWLLVLFFAIVIMVLSIDLVWLKGGRNHRVSTREALGWSLVWIGLALIFNVILWWSLYATHGVDIANRKSLEFFTGYLIEKSLSVDNLFVFIMIFHYFEIKVEQQRKLLLYGVISAILMRLVIILFGIWLVNRFDWIFYVFGILLLMSAVRLLFFDDDSHSLDNNVIMKISRRLFRVSHEKQDNRFFFMKNNKLYITPLLMAIIFIEFSDLIFAVDSIPAVFAITRDPIIVFTSNVFAILGLRAMYFLMANMNEQFYYLRHGLALILVFIAVKMLVHDLIDIPIVMTLGVIVTVLSVSIIGSVFSGKKR
ncbi:TerC/Alx family metal homeostasis membrane protein [Legionella spiritensis]|uniref:Drug efflux protein n=1 Tax=Legionella spiritensis TaxID=452 RepID=A0A0W0Z843_LEGSP|nr:TerC/Alx family metal homeostasis membrane protein [Legionella spiritensis]KTD65276.1 drug efflux protein [Legionella spiritensis]SNV30158.1 drug efflux protein [Legionella spiritensis]